MSEKKGNWSKLTEYLQAMTCDEKSKPKMILLSQKNLLDITGSIQKAKLQIDHSDNSIRDRADAAGFNVTKSLLPTSCLGGIIQC